MMTMQDFLDAASPDDPEEELRKRFGIPAGTPASGPGSNVLDMNNKVSPANPAQIVPPTTGPGSPIMNINNPVTPAIPAGIKAMPYSSGPGSSILDINNSPATVHDVGQSPQEQIANHLLGLSGFGAGGLGVSNPATQFGPSMAPSSAMQASPGNPPGPWEKSTLPYIPPGAGWGTNPHPSDDLFNARANQFFANDANAAEAQAANPGAFFRNVLNAQTERDRLSNQLATAREGMANQLQIERERGATDIQKTGMQVGAARPADEKLAFGPGPASLKDSAQQKMVRQGTFTQPEINKFNVESLFFDDQNKPITHLQPSQVPAILSQAGSLPRLDPTELYSQLSKKGVNDNELRKLMIDIALSGEAHNLKKLPSGTTFPSELLSTPYANVQKGWDIFNPAANYRSVKNDIYGHPNYGILKPEQIQQLDLLSQMYPMMKD